jgi:IS5 family transposase
MRPFHGSGQGLGCDAQGPKSWRFDPLEESANCLIASVKVRVELPFRIIKCQFGNVKTRYRGLAKNRAQLFTLGNLFLKRCRVMK